MYQLLFAFFSLILCTATPLFTQQPVKLGSDTPPLSTLQWIGSPPPSPDYFTGKFVVLEFWTTWCGPCIQAIPHINDLAARYQSENLGFVSINFGEEREKVEKFLQKVDVQTMIGFDPSSTFAIALGVGSIPHTAIVDGEGKLIWYGRPHHLTDEFMEYLVRNGEPLPAKSEEDRRKISLSVTESAPTESSGLSWNFETMRAATISAYQATGIIKNIITFLGSHSYRIREVNDSLRDTKEYTLSIDVGQDVDMKALLPSVVAQLDVIFQTKTEWVKELTPVYILKLGDEKKLREIRGEDEGKSSSELKNQKLVWNNVAPRKLTSYLEDKWGIPCLDETGCTSEERYNLVLPELSRENIEETITTLQHQGFQLVKEERELEFVVITHLGQQQE
ncbi:MAG: TlpA family protein disulfide reductase [Candidatus Kapaibacterium sp.]